jgi:tetratricopeptide (TPR) repeat protein
MNRMIIHLHKIFILIAFFIIILTIPSLAQTSQIQFKVDRSEIVLQFQKQSFKSLNSKLEELQQAFEQNYQAEDCVFDAFEVFKKTDPSYDPILQNWVKQFPDSYASYVARAEYYSACAVQARGKKRVLNKDDNEYKQMERYYSLALLDIDQALKLNIKMDVCYALKVEIGMALGKEELITNALGEATKYHPYGYRVRLKYMQTLTPRNGGSYQKMDEFIASCAALAIHNPKIKELTAAIPADKGSASSYLGKYDQAVKMYTEALKYSNYHSYYADRGDAYVKLQDYRRALIDYDQALEKSPNDPEYLRRKTQALSQQDHSIEAQRIEAQRIEAQRIETQRIEKQSKQEDTYDDWSSEKSNEKGKQQGIEHVQKASSLLRVGQYEQAISEYTEAISFFPDEYNLYHNRAICYLRLNNDEAALQDYHRAIEKNSNDIDAYIKIMYIHANRGAYDEALNSINAVISLDPGNGETIYLRAKIYERKGMNIEALQDARQACALGYQRACMEYRIGR